MMSTSDLISIIESDKAPHRNLFMFLFIHFYVMMAMSEKWFQQFESLIRPDSHQAIGYYNQTIYLIGGYFNKRQLIEYETETNTITSDNENDPSISTEIYGLAQFYAQNSQILYMVLSESLVVYNLESKTMEIWDQYVLPQSVGNRACLAEYQNWLFVVGGFDIIRLNTTQIFDITNKQWLEHTPSLNTARNDMSCIIHPHTQSLYVFGGYNGTYLSSIEILNVADVLHIGNWNINSNNLLQKHSLSRAVIFGMNIFIIGGYYTDELAQGYYIQQEQIYNILDGTLEYGELMTISMAYAAAIYISDANYTIYTFGGYNGSNSFNIIQSLTLGPPLTIDPTNQPSVVPSTNPSQSPSNDPSTNPSQSPSNDPTLGPAYMTTESVNISIVPTQSMRSGESIQSTVTTKIKQRVSDTIKKNNQYIIIIVVMIVILTILMICIGFYLIKKRRRNRERIINQTMENNVEMKQYKDSNTINKLKSVSNHQNNEGTTPMTNITVDDDNEHDTDEDILKEVQNTIGNDNMGEFEIVEQENMITRQNT
eukprot:444593_1